MFLLSTLIISSVVVMFLGAAVALAPGGLRQSAQARDVDAAERAALCGQEYVLARIKQYGNYCSGGIDQQGAGKAVINQPNMFVWEENGNIVGLMWDANNENVSQFRVRFNYQDGKPANATEKLPDPPAAMKMDLTQLSVNNAAGGFPRPVPKVTGTAPNFAVPNNFTTVAMVPTHATYLVVEGRAGKGLQTLSRTNPNAAPGWGGVTTKTVTGVYKVSGVSAVTTSAVVMSRGDFDIREVAATNMSSATSTPARVRSGGGISVKDTANNVAQIYTPDQQAFLMNPSANAVATVTGSNVSKATDSGGDFYKLAWSDIPSAPATASKLKAGTYIVDQAGTLTYYNMNHGDYIKAMRSGTPPTGTVLTATDLPPGVTFGNASNTSVPNWELKITRDVLIEATAKSNDFAFMPKRGAVPGPGFTASGNTTNNFSNYFYFNSTTGTFQRSHDLREAGLIQSDRIGRSLRTVASAGGLGSTDMSGNYGFDVPVGNSTVHVGYNSGNNDWENRMLEISGLPNDPVAVQDFLNALYVAFPDNPSGTVADAIHTFQQNVGGSNGLGGDVNLATGSTDTLSTDQLSLNISPTTGTATLTGPAGFTLGANLVGNGGSITSQGDINLFGFGVDLVANPNAENSISLYAKGDINLSTFYQSQINSADGQPAATGYDDVSITGVMYAWGNIKIGVGDPHNSSTWRDFKLTGSMISYGGDPAGSNTTDTDISITARATKLKFDEAYLLNLMASLPGVTFQRISYGIR